LRFSFAKIRILDFVRGWISKVGAVGAAEFEAVEAGLPKFDGEILRVWVSTIGLFRAAQTFEVMGKLVDLPVEMEKSEEALDVAWSLVEQIAGLEVEICFASSRQTYEAEEKPVGSSLEPIARLEVLNVVLGHPKSFRHIDLD
jgi:hypothetical protein